MKFASRYLEGSSYMWSSSLSLDSSSFESSFSFKFVPAVPTVPSPGARAMLSRRSCDRLWGWGKRMNQHKVMLGIEASFLV